MLPVDTSNTQKLSANSTRLYTASSSTQTRKPDNSKTSLSFNNSIIFYDSIIFNDNNNNNKSSITDYNLGNNLNDSFNYNNNSNNFNNSKINSGIPNNLHGNHVPVNKQSTINTNFDSRDNKFSAPYAFTLQYNNRHTDLIERRELFIPGFMKINNESKLRSIAFSILKTLITSLNLSDISGVRFVNSKSSCKNMTMTVFPSFIITLVNSNLVKIVMFAKKSYNYFTTRDLNPLTLDSEVSVTLPDSKIFINEVLSSSTRLKYISIKETAKKLGFKYVWHSNSDFLVRWGDNMRSHAVSNLSELNVLLKSIDSTTRHNDVPSVSYFPELASLSLHND